MNGIGAVLNLQARSRRNALGAMQVLAHRRGQQNEADAATRAAEAQAVVREHGTVAGPLVGG